MLEPLAIGKADEAVARSKQAKDERTVGLNPRPETDSKQRGDVEQKRGECSGSFSE